MRNIRSSNFRSQHWVYRFTSSNISKLTLGHKDLLKIGFLLFMSISLLSCNNKTFKTEKELLAYIKDTQNGFTQHKSVNGIDFTLVYKPTDLLVLQELGDTKNAKKISALRAKYNKYLYYNLSISKNNKELLSVVPKNRNEFGAMVNQLAFGMKSKVHLYTTTKDTLALLDHIYPRMYGMSHTTSMLFVYKRDQEKLKGEYLNFTVEDLGLYTGEVKFKTLTKNFRTEPTLHL